MSVANELTIRGANPSRFNVCAGGMSVLLGFCLLAWQSSWAREILRGPRSVTEADLRVIGDGVEPPGDYIAFETTAIVETGLWGTDHRRRRVSRYVLVPIGDQWAVASVPVNHQGNRLTGYLKRHDHWQSKIAIPIEQIRDSLPGRPLTPYYISASHDQRAEALAFFALTGLLTSVGGWFCLIGLRRLRGAFGLGDDTATDLGTAPNPVP